MDGGEGIDKVVYSAASGGVNVDLSTGLATGAMGSDTLSGIENIEGSAYNDTLIGSDTANEIKAEAGDDVIDGGLGNDVLDGGEGIDKVLYSEATDGVNVDLAEGLATGAMGSDTLSGIENI